MADEEHRQAETGAEVLQQVQDLGLHGDIERGDRLVGDDQLWLHGERPGDADALALAAGEFMWIAVGMLRLQADELQEFGDAPAALRAAGEAVGVQRLADDAADAQARVEAGVGVLEDHLHAPPVGPHGALA